LIQTFRTAWAPKQVQGLAERLEGIEGRVRQQAVRKVEEDLALLESERAVSTSPRPPRIG
jgi:hypothetical protein